MRSMEPLGLPGSLAGGSRGQQQKAKDGPADLHRAPSADIAEQKKNRRSATETTETRKHGLRRLVGRKTKARGEQRRRNVELIGFSYPQDRVIRLVPAIQPTAAPQKGCMCQGPEDGEGLPETAKETDKGAATLPATQDLCLRIPFSHRRVPLYTEKPRRTNTRSSGLQSSAILGPLLQRLFCCCSPAPVAVGSRKRHAAHRYICSHILQEAAWRIHEATELVIDPFAKENDPKLSSLLPLSSGNSVHSSKGAPLSTRDSEEAKEALLQNPKVAFLLDYYERLLAAEMLQLVPRGGRCFSPFDAGAASAEDLLGLTASSRFSRCLLSMPLFSCLPIAPWHLWWPKESLAVKRRCAFRVSLQLLHISLSDCHLFREEDLVAQKLLSAYEVYAYLARCSSGEQLTAKLRSCLQYTKEIRESCGLPRELNPLQQAAAAAVAAYRRDQPLQVQHDRLQQKLQQIQNLPHQVLQLTRWLCSLKTSYPQVRPCSTGTSSRNIKCSEQKQQHSLRLYDLNVCGVYPLLSVSAGRRFRLRELSVFLSPSMTEERRVETKAFSVSFQEENRSCEPHFAALQLWKQWLGHLQQRRLLRLQRDQQRQQFAAAGETIEKLWQQLQRQRDLQQFDCTGLQLQLLLLSYENKTALLLLPLRSPEFCCSFALPLHRLLPPPPVQHSNSQHDCCCCCLGFAHAGEKRKLRSSCWERR